MVANNHSSAETIDGDETDDAARHTISILLVTSSLTYCASDSMFWLTNARGYNFSRSNYLLTFLARQRRMTREY